MCVCVFLCIFSFAIYPRMSFKINHRTIQMQFSYYNGRSHCILLIISTIVADCTEMGLVNDVYPAQIARVTNNIIYK